MGIFFKVFGFWFLVSVLVFGFCFVKHNSQTQKVNDKMDTEKPENVFEKMFLRNGH
jgi:hypothetical protein